MKKAEKGGIRRFETARRNEHLFYRKCCKDDLRLFRFLQTISRAYSPRPISFFLLPEYDFEKRFSLRSTIIAQGWEITDSLSETKRDEFLEKIHAIMGVYDFGMEWESSLVAYVMTRLLCPPVFNLYIDKKYTEIPAKKTRRLRPSLKAKIMERVGDKRFKREKVRVVLILNPDTTIEDIKDAYEEIRGRQRSLWPNFEGFNLNKDSVRRLIKEMTTMSEKYNIPDEEKYANLDRYYERPIIKKYGEQMGKKIILDSRQKLMEDAKKKKPINKLIIIKSKKTDLEIVKGWGVKGADKIKQATNQLRQERRRVRR